MKRGSLRDRRLRNAKARRVAPARQRDIADGIEIGKHSNQKISRWPQGKLRSYIAYKALILGMETWLEEELYCFLTS